MRKTFGNEIPDTAAYMVPRGRGCLGTGGSDLRRPVRGRRSELTLGRKRAELNQIRSSERHRA